ncbi:hypothetical protein DEU56DRAFT_759829 [Suillus clintonianus]|uniref:uncharacterized protein n=1 Tax=Suillus clintonianus TaxID=1904413 RepID=UPI001B87EE26|nr:uncharacterized protein DEU56DRAFT_759829 [Suillus clintonianus]KAG2124047.1 hypothetical protein DEU56DRAFT_759829 [Suillus clintonianus]
MSDSRQQQHPQQPSTPDPFPVPQVPLHSTHAQSSHLRTRGKDRSGKTPTNRADVHYQKDQQSWTVCFWERQNACGLYCKLHKYLRWLRCYNCHTTAMPLWRKDNKGKTVCNVCGLYYKLHSLARPISMKSDIIRKHSRHDARAQSSSLTEPPSASNTPGMLLRLAFTSVHQTHAVIHKQADASIRTIPNHGRQIYLLLISKCHLSFIPLLLTHSLSIPNCVRAFTSLDGKTHIGLGRQPQEEMFKKTNEIRQESMPEKETTTEKRETSFSLSLASLPSSFTTLLLSILDSPAYANLTSSYLNNVFNPATPNDPRVKYFSITGRTADMSIWHRFVSRARLRSDLGEFRTNAQLRLEDYLERESVLSEIVVILR